MIERWVKENGAGLREPNAMTLSTVGPDGIPSSRVVLVRGYSPVGLFFYTNYASEKGSNLSHQPAASVNFYWDQLQKQIRASGPVTKLSPEASDNYWAARPRPSQISQWVSQQSSPVRSREQMLAEYAAAEKKFAGAESIPRPAHWGGYEIKLQKVEFWIGQPNRFHDRMVFSFEHNKWLGKRLYPWFSWAA